MRYLAIATLLLCFTLQACKHSVLHTPSAPVKLNPPPRYPLNAVFVSEVGNSDVAAEARKRLEESGYFASLRTTATIESDIEIRYLKTECDQRDHITDSFLGTWLVMMPLGLLITFPTLGMVPAMNAGEWDCRRNFSFRWLKGSDTQTRSVSHHYVDTEYVTTFTHALYTSAERERYQLAYSVDQAVAELLNAISNSLTPATR